MKIGRLKNAQTVLMALGAIMVTLFVGITVLAAAHGVVPRDEETVVSQLARSVFGGGLFYYFIQGISFLEYVDHLLALGDNHVVTIIIPEFIPARWWQHLLHNQTALLIKGALLFRRNVIVSDVPYHLSR